MIFTTSFARLGCNAKSERLLFLKQDIGVGKRIWRPIREKNRTTRLPLGVPKRNHHHAMFINATHCVYDNKCLINIVSLNAEKFIAFDRPSPQPNWQVSHHLSSLKATTTRGRSKSNNTHLLIAFVEHSVKFPTTIHFKDYRAAVVSNHGPLVAKT